jgi:tetratricopeptide (TPR) repeat protein
MGDDSFLILTNPQITSDRPLRELLLTDWFNRSATEAIGYYRPVVKAGFRATYALVGAEPFAYHLTNWLLHAGTALLLALLLRRFVPPVAAALGASLFAAHPATVQAVSIITARSDVLAAFFCVAACVAYARWTEGRRPGWLAVGAACFALAAGSKESALLLPALLPVVARIRRVAVRPAVLSLLPFVGVALLYMALRGQLDVRPIPNALAHLGWGGRLMASLTALGGYAGPLMLGHEIVRLPWLPRSVLEPGVLLGAVAVLGGLAALAWTRLQRPLALGLLWVGIGLGPVLAIWVLHIPMWKESIPIAERWLYLPCVGLGFCAALLLARLRGRAPVLLGAGLCLALGVETVLRTPTLASDEVYSRYVAQVYREAPLEKLSPRERYILRVDDAQQAFNRGEAEAALAAFEAITREMPGLPGGWLELARVAEALGRPQVAVRARELLVSKEFLEGERAQDERKAHGDDGLARLDAVTQYTLLGQGYLALERLEDAERAFRIAAKLARNTPREPGLMSAYADVLERRGQYPRAREVHTVLAAHGFVDSELALARLDVREGQPRRARERLDGLVRKGGAAAEEARRQLATLPAP